MLCDRCKRREATIHITKIMNGKRIDLNLCSVCAHEQGQLGQQGDFNIFDDDFFRKMVYPDSPKGDETELQCPTCGMTYSEFNRSGKLGCPDCYTTFREELVPLLRRIHGHSKHAGKVPNRGTGVFRTANQIKRLRQRLQRLIRDENYEQAVTVRDEIRALEKQMQAPEQTKEE
jgi:protein arginine kinase activator